MKLAGAQWTSWVEMLCMGSALKTNIDENSPYICTTMEGRTMKIESSESMLKMMIMGVINHNDYEGDLMITRLMCMKGVCQARPA